MNGNNNNQPNGLPYYHGTGPGQNGQGQDGEYRPPGSGIGSGTGTGGVQRYVPPHLRSEEVVRPESSMSNTTNNTFATQVPNNYAHGTAQLTHSMAAFNPFGINGQQSTAQLRPFMGASLTRPGAPGFDRSNNVNTTQPAPSFGRGITNTNTNGYQGPNQSINGNVMSWIPTAAAYPTAFVAPTPLRVDSTVTNQTRAEYLAARIMQGHADNPLDIDYGNPGPTRRPAPPPEPIPFPPAYRSAAENPRLPSIRGKQVQENTEGNLGAFLGNRRVVIPAWLAAAIDTGAVPTMEQAFECLPFIEPCRIAVPSTAGVVKIADIPYATTRAEVNAFLGRNAKICYQPAGTGFQAVHIVMDRSSGKTMDAFVEVANQHEAVWVVNQFQKRTLERRPGKIGGRVVHVKLSSQDELMATLFPRARQTTWKNGVPVIDPSKAEYYPGVYAEGFKGFMQDEEIASIQQHAEKPQRSPFVIRCLVRTYEYLISTLHKYPWFDIEHVLLTERDALFDATHAAVRALIELLRRIDGNQPDTSKPTIATLNELAVAVLLCPGFTDTQKNSVATTLNNAGFARFTDDRPLNLHFGGIGPLDSQMPFKVLCRKPGVETKVLEYYASLLSEATIGVRQLSLADIHALNAGAMRNDPKKFGDLQITYDGNNTIAAAGRAELRYIEEVLGRILPRQRQILTGLGSDAASGSAAGSGSGTATGSGSGSGSGSRRTAFRVPQWSSVLYTTTPSTTIFPAC